MTGSTGVGGGRAETIAFFSLASKFPGEICLRDSEYFLLSVHPPWQKSFHV